MVEIVLMKLLGGGTLIILGVLCLICGIVEGEILSAILSSLAFNILGIVLIYSIDERR